MTRKTQQEMFPLMEQWATSGESRESFCKLHTIPLSTFSYWRGKFIKAQSHREGSPDFVKLQPTTATRLEVVYPNGVTVRVVENLDLVSLRALIQLI